MAIKFDITGDNSSMINALNGVQTKVAHTAKDVEKSGITIEQMFDRVKNAANIAIAGISFKNLVDRVVETRGEFQQLEVAFQTMLGSADKANNLMSQLIETAATTPFDLQGVATGAKQLLAYGTAAEDVNSTLIKLGNIAAGLSLNLNDLVWLYGTTMTQGRMFTMDLRQFMGRGIPMAEAIADVLGTTKDKVAGLVSAGKVTADVVNKAIDKMATGTGKFAGLMDAQSRTITGQISNIEDAIDMMFNDIGKNTEGIINGALDTVSWLIDHYKEVGEVVLTAAAAFGEYKASLMLTAAAQKALQNQKDTIETARQEGLGKILADNSSDASDTAATAASTAATDADTAARQANKTAIDEQIAALQQSLAAKVAEAEANFNQAMSEAADAALAVDAAKEKVKSAQEAYEAALQTGNAEKIAAAETEVNTAQAYANSAAKDLQAKRAGAHTAAQTVETAKTKEQAVATQINTVNTQAATTATGLWAAVTKTATTAFNSLKVALMTNPFTAVIMGLTVLAGLIPMFVSGTEEVSGALQKLRDTVRENQGKLMSYKAILENCDRSMQMYKDTVSSFNQLAKQYNTTQISVTSTLGEQEKAYNELTEAIRRQAAEKILADTGQDAVKKASDIEREAMDDLMDDAKNFSYTINQVVGTTSTGMVTYATSTANSIRNISQDMWGAISAEVMSKAEAMADAFNKSPQAAENFVVQEQETIENMLRSMGANNDDIAAFGGTIRSYLMDVGKGFAENYGELERTQQQLLGLQSATITLGDVTTESIKTYSYEQLQQALQQVQNEIDNTNKKKLDPQVKTERLEYLKGLLKDINNLMPAQFTKGSLKDLQSRLKQAKDTRDSLDPQKDAKDWKKANDEVRQLNNAIKKRTKLSAENEEKNASKQKASERKENRAAEKRRKAQEKVNEDLRQLRQQNIDDDISQMREGTEKKLAEIKSDYKKRLAEIDKQEKEFKKKNKEAGKKGDLTKEQSDAISEARKLAEQGYDKKVVDVYKDQVSALNDYLKEFGTFKEKQLAIELEYDKRIKDAEENGNTFEAMTLRAQKLREASSNKASQLESQIDYSTVFGEFGIVLKAQMQTALQSMKDFAKTSAFKSKPINEQKDFLQRMNQISQKYGTSQWSEYNFKTVGSLLDTYTKKLTSRNKAEEKLNKSSQDVIDANKEYQEVLKKGTDEQKKAAKDKLGNAVSINEKDREKLQSAESEMVQAQNDVTNAASKLQGTLTSLDSLLGSMKSGSLSSVWQAFTDFDQKVNGGKATEAVTKVASKVLSKAFEGKTDIISMIIGAILNLLDVLKDQGVGGLVSGLIESICGAIDGIADNIATGEFLEQIVNSLVKGLGKLLERVDIQSPIPGISFNTSISDLLTNSNAEEIADKREELIEEAEKLTKSIDSLKTELSNQSGAKAISTANELKQQQEQFIENAMKQLINENEYHGAHHSNAYYWGNNSLEKYDHGSWAEITKALQEYKKKNPNADTKTDSASSYEDLLKLTPEQMNYIRSYYKEQWQAIKDVGKYDASDEKWEAYADLAGTLQETADSLNEALTQTSFDSLKDEFISTLMDMDSSAADFSDKFSEYLMQAVLNAQISNLMGDEMESFYKEWASRAKQGNGTLTSSDITYLKEMWDSLVQQGFAIRDQAASITGYTGSSSQTATSGGWSSMGQETADELNGRFTALQIAGETVAQDMEATIAMMETLVTLGMSTNGAVLEIRNMMIMTNSYLEDVVKYAKLTYTDFGSKLDDMNARLKNI